MSETVTTTEEKQFENFELPVKRVEGDTVEDRLTENAHDRILPARYLLKDEDGEVIETPEEMFERVAKNVAQPAKEYEYRDYEEEWKRFYDLMTNLEFMPNSPTLMNAGTDLQQLSACFVVHPEDDMDSIFESVHDAANIFQTGGGVGYPFHLMRPKGDPVASTGGIASGPLTFQQVFDTMCGTIKQGGKRRGAQMGIMRVDHPDVLRFIVSKRKEGNLSNFNISVGLTDDFMDAVQNDDHFTLINPRDGEPHTVTDKTAEFYNNDEEWYPEAEGSDQGRDDNFWRDFAHTFSEDIEEYDIDLEPGETMELPARFIWEALIDGAWRNGEPGLYAYDTSNQMHSFDVEEHPEHTMEATNPSLRASTKVLTNHGIMPIEELEGEEFRVPTLSGEWGDAECFLSSENETLFRIKLRSGKEYYATSEHKWPVKTDDGYEKKETTEVDEGDYLPYPNRSELGYGDEGTYDDGFLIGWLYGDGSITDRKNGVRQFGFTFSSDDLDSCMPRVLDRLEEISDTEFNPTERRREGEPWFEVHTRNQNVREFMECFGVGQKENGLPDAIWDTASEEFRQGFIDGLFSADGYVDDGNGQTQARMILVTSRKSVAEEVGELLAFYGINHSIREDETENWGETYERYDLKIGKHSTLQFRDTFELTNTDKRNRLEAVEDAERGNIRDNHVMVESVEETEKQESVWDITVYEDTHTFRLSHAVTGNCAEQPLENYEACNLGHINLSLLVEDQGDGKGLNWHDWKEEHDYDYDEELDEAMQEFLQQALRMEKFEEVAKTATRFLDNVATMSDFPLEEIEEKVSEMRKIGLGLMGLAQMLIQLGIRYGSDESQAASKEIQRLISKWAVESSHQLAKERGVFKEWEKSKWSNPEEHPEWFKRYTGGKEPEDWEGGMELRNHKHTTIAPTGTTSMIANTSGGCEPIYSLAYFKNVAKDIQGEDMLVEFDDYFLQALEANDVDIEKVKENAEELMRNNEWEGVQSVPDDVLPPEMKELFTTSDRVEPREHVDVQAALQEHNHSGISKTINFPNDASREDVAEAYMRAYNRGIKGMTVYRDGARDVQVMTTREDNKLEDLDKSDMIAQLVDEFGSTEEFLTSKEFREAAGLKEESGMVVKKNGNGSYETQTIEPGDETGVAKEGSQKEPRERPEIISGTTQKIDTGYGGMYVTINEDENGIFEVFLQLGKSGGYTQSFTDAIGRLVSTALRAGIDEEEVIEQLEGIRSPKVAWDNSEQILSVPDGVAKAMKRYLSGEASAAQTSVTNFADEEQDTGEVGKEPASSDSRSDTSKMIGQGMNPECPECGGMLQLQEGCKTCPECGWSECE